MPSTKTSFRTYTTVLTRGYTHDVANDQASAGGVHLTQIRKTATGGWFKRIKQSNGRFSAVSNTESITGQQAMALIEQARREGEI